MTDKQRHVIRRLSSAALVSCAVMCLPLALAGCNTVEGAGEDIEAAGEVIDDAAEDAN